MPNTYLFILFVCILWIITINLLRIQLQKNADINKDHAYYLEFKLLSYRNGEIYGETRKHERHELKDYEREWGSYVLNHIGEWVRIEYDIIYEGHIFITIESVIHNITPI